MFGRACAAVAGAGYSGRVMDFAVRQQSILLSRTQDILPARCSGRDICVAIASP